jgi:hypothetical protein
MTTTLLIIAAVYLALMCAATAYILYLGVRGRIDYRRRQNQPLSHYERPCSRCSEQTAWSWYGRPLCPTCRKREIEATQ